MRSDINMLFIGTVSPDVDQIDRYFRQNNINAHFIERANATAIERGFCPHPDIVILNLQEVTVTSQRDVKAARAFGVPVICTISLEDSEKASLLAQLAFDDLLLRPYRLKDLLCRVTRLLYHRRKVDGEVVVEKRRKFRRQSDQQRYQPWRPVANSGPITIDDLHKVVKLGDRSIELTPKEYKLMCLLASEPGRVFSSDEIITRCWHSDRRANSADVQQYVHLLRKKVEIAPNNPKWIVTVKGFGYKLEAQTDERQ